MNIAAQVVGDGQGSLGGKNLWRCEVRPQPQSSEERKWPLLPPLWIPAFAGMTKLGAGLRKGCCSIGEGMRGCLSGVYPGSESGTCFHSNDGPAGTPLSGDKTQRHTLLSRPACWIRVDWPRPDVTAGGAGHG